jgi:hypothetical protein
LSKQNRQSMPSKHFAEGAEATNGGGCPSLLGGKRNSESCSQEQPKHGITMVGPRSTRRLHFADEVAPAADAKLPVMLGRLQAGISTECRSARELSGSPGEGAADMAHQTAAQARLAFIERQARASERNRGITVP